MVYDPGLLDGIESLGTAPFDGTVWRHMFNDYDPARANTRGARWNPPGVAAIYTSLERGTVLAEANYAIELQPLRPRASRHLYQLHVGLQRVADLTDRSMLRGLGVGDRELAEVDQEVCRTIGGAAHWLESDGILVPSARADARTS